MLYDIFMEKDGWIIMEQKKEERNWLSSTLMQTGKALYVMYVVFLVPTDRIIHLYVSSYHILYLL